MHYVVHETRTSPFSNILPVKINLHVEPSNWIGKFEGLSIMDRAKVSFTFPSEKTYLQLSSTIYTYTVSTSKHEHTLIAALKDDSAILLFWNIVGILSNNSSKCWRHWIHTRNQNKLLKIIKVVSVSKRKNHNSTMTIHLLALEDQKGSAETMEGLQSRWLTSESGTITSVCKGV